MVRRSVAFVLVSCMLLLQGRPALAQAAQTLDPAAVATARKAESNDCFEQGRSAGRHAGAGGAFVIGLTSGLLFGLTGTVIAYGSQREPEPPVDAQYQSADPGCRMAYRYAFGRAGKQHKKLATLTGGLLGTAVILAVLVSRGSH